MNNVYAYCIPLPKGIKGVTVPKTDDGDYIIFVNAHLCDETRKCVLAHELRHTRYDHFCDMTDVRDAERQADAV